MARPRRHSDDAMLDAARDLLLAGGPEAATTASISAASGAPVGSLYHRFGSRPQLLAEVWLRTVRRFQDGFEAAAGHGTTAHDRALAAALWTVDFAASHPDDARLLLRTSRSELLGRADLPAGVGRALDGLNRPMVALLRRLTTDLYGSPTADRLELVTIAVVDVPYAIVRRHLRRPGRTHRLNRAHVEWAVRALLAAG